MQEFLPEVGMSVPSDRIALLYSEVGNSPISISKSSYTLLVER